MQGRVRSRIALTPTYRIPEVTASHSRLDSLDVFRGATIAAMILVSTPGTWEAVYGPLNHAAWHGWTPTDLIGPFLLFAMGAAGPFAMRRRRQNGRVWLHVLRRGAILFALGLVLTAIQAPWPLVWSTFRIPGVLQRIAIVYVIVAGLTEKTSLRTQIGIAVVALFGYWGLMMLVPLPGLGTGQLSQGGNLASVIDARLLGRHMARPTWDPEGILSTIPAIATALLGVFAGEWLRQNGGHRRTVVLWAVGLAATVGGLLWGRVFPINKNLWTSSFALFSAGMATQALAFVHRLLDLNDSRWWAEPFVAFGRNPLAGYFLSVCLDSILTRLVIPGDDTVKANLYQQTFARWLAPCCGAEAASLAYAVTHVALWAIVLGLMRRRRIFIGV